MKHLIVESVNERDQVQGVSFGLWALVVSVGLYLVGLTTLALGQSSPPSQVQDFQSVLEEILKRLDRIETTRQNAIPSWDQKLDSSDGDKHGCNSTRFTCLWPDKDGRPKAVRDNETGQVWERFPDMAGGVNGDGKRTWGGALSYCVNREIEGRKGWRLPMREELASLLDPSGLSPFLPRGHPFQTVQSISYWTATTDVTDPKTAWFVSFSDGILFPSNKNTLYAVWCVRGGSGVDGIP